MFLDFRTLFWTAVFLLGQARRWQGMKLMTGGKSHLDIGKETNQTTSGLSATPRVVRRNAGDNDLDMMPFRNRLTEASINPQFTVTAAERINTFSPMYARLLASLSAGFRRGTGLGSQPGLGVRNPNMLHGDSSNRRKRQAPSLLTPFTVTNSSECPAVEPHACRDAPFDAMVPHDDMLLAFKDGVIHLLAANGSIIAHEPLDTDHVFPALPNHVTGALRMRDFVYVFFGDTYMKFRPVRRPIFPTPVPVQTGFHGVPIPVDGAFQLNSHTYVIISGSTFVFYQPDAEPPINPKFSPNLLAHITGGPQNVTTAFNTPDGRRFLASAGLLYELNDRMQVIKIQPFKKRPDGFGWLDCTPVAPPVCIKAPLVTTTPIIPFQKFAQQQNDTIQFSSGTSLFGNSIRPADPLPHGNTTDGAASSERTNIWAPGRFDMRAIQTANSTTGNHSITTTSKRMVNSSQESQTSSSTITRSNDTTNAGLSTVQFSSVQTTVRRPRVSGKSSKTRAGKAGSVSSLLPAHAASGLEDADDISDDVRAAIGSAGVGKTSREELSKPTDSVFAQQLADHSVVLRELMDKLKNLTQAMATIPAPNPPV